MCDIGPTPTSFDRGIGCWQISFKNLQVATKASSQRHLSFAKLPHLLTPIIHPTRCASIGSPFVTLFVFLYFYIFIFLYIFYFS
jgi:hypothetical protein